MAGPRIETFTLTGSELPPQWQDITRTQTATAGHTRRSAGNRPTRPDSNITGKTAVTSTTPAYRMSTVGGAIQGVVYDTLNLIIRCAPERHPPARTRR